MHGKEAFFRKLRANQLETAFTALTGKLVYHFLNEWLYEGWVFGTAVKTLLGMPDFRS